MLVYMLLNTVNEKCYVGLTVARMRQRIKQHVRHVRGDPRGGRLYDDMRSYPLECWEAIVLERFTDIDAMLKAERSWIQACGSLDPAVGYNEVLPDEAYAERFKKQNPGPYKDEPEVGWMNLDGHMECLHDAYAAANGQAKRLKTVTQEWFDEATKPPTTSKRKNDMTVEELEYFRMCGRRALEVRGLDFYQTQGRKGGAAKHVTSASSEEMSRRTKIGRTRGPAKK